MLLIQHSDQIILFGERSSEIKKKKTLGVSVAPPVSAEKVPHQPVVLFCFFLISVQTPGQLERNRG